MKIAFISDIHSNLPALNKVLEDIPKNVDKIVCTGDIIGYGPWPKECVDIIKDTCDFVVQGNHDRQVHYPEKYSQNKGAYEGLKYALSELSKSDVKWLQSLNEKQYIKNYMIVHSHPVQTDLYVYPSDFKSMGKYIKDFDGLIMGHTHKQHAEYTKENKLIINPGSVGQPRDGDSRAAYAILDAEKNEVQLNRVEYDIEKTINKIKEVGLPVKSGERLRQ